MRPFADAKDKQNFDEFVDDFCDSYDEALPQETTFVKALNSIDDPETFQDACFEQLAAQPTLNTWYSPIDPLSSITQKEICDLHYKLFASLKEKQRTSLSEYVSFSYLASLDLFLNAHQQEDFENCVNQQVVASPAEWTASFVNTHPAFQNWDSTNKFNVAGSAAKAVTDGCADKVACAAAGTCQACDGCSIAISQIYKTYEVYLNNLFASTFKEHSEAMFNKLHTANLALETPQ